MQSNPLETEFVSTEGREGYATPETFKARLMWASRAVVSDYTREGGPVYRAAQFCLLQPGLDPMNQSNQAVTLICGQENGP